VKLYDKRSNLVHGAIKKEVELEEVEFLSSLVRESLLRYTVLQLRGISSVGAILKRIRHAIFDPESSTKLHRDSNLRDFILEKEGLEISI